MQLVKSDKDSLGQVQRRVSSGWNRDEDVGTIEDLVGKSLVLSSKKNRHRSGASEIQKINARISWCRDVTLGGPSPRREPRDAGAPSESVLDGIAVCNALDDIRGSVRDTFESPGIVRDRAYQVQTRASHILHRADSRRDVDRILRLVQDDSYSGENRLRGVRRFLPRLVSVPHHKVAAK